MNIPSWLASLIVASLFGLEAWTLNEVINLKVSVAAMSSRLPSTATHIAGSLNE